MALTKKQLEVYHHKLVLLGDSAVGKSSLALRYVKQEFNQFQDSTIGATFLTQRVELFDAIVHFEIWDTAGQERYHSLAPMYYRGASCAIVVYDVTDMPSYIRAKGWVKELRSIGGNPDMVIMLVCNKMDLADRRVVDFNEVKKYAMDSNILFIEASAKQNYNVDEIFEKIAIAVPKVKSAIESNFIMMEETEGKKCCFR